MRESVTQPDGTPRRRTVLAAGAAGLAGLAGGLSGCAVYGRQPATPPQPPPGGEPGDPADNTITTTGEIPVGGGVIGAGVVVTQPADGDFRAFSSICTHQGCAVTEVRDGTINCLCHGSRFSIVDGSVVQAAQGLSPDQQAPLPSVAISVQGDTVSRA